MKTTQWDAADYLDTPEAVLAYLEETASSGDRAEFVAALKAAVRGMEGRPRFKLADLLEGEPPNEKLKELYQQGRRQRVNPLEIK